MAAFRQCTQSRGYSLDRKSVLRIVFLVLVGTTVSVFFFGPWALRQVAIDRCLDSGGKFDYGTDECVGAKSKE